MSNEEVLHFSDVEEEEVTKASPPQPNLTTEEKFVDVDDGTEHLKKTLLARSGVSTLEMFIMQVLGLDRKKFGRCDAYTQRQEARKIVTKLMERRYRGFAMISFNYAWWRFFKAFMVHTVDSNTSSDMYLENVVTDSWARDNKYLDLFRSMDNAEEVKDEMLKLEDRFFDTIIDLLKLTVCLEHLKNNFEWEC